MKALETKETTKERKKRRKKADAACLGMRSSVAFCRELWSLFLQLRLLRLQTKIGLRASPEPGSQRASASAHWGGGRKTSLLSHSSLSRVITSRSRVQKPKESLTRVSDELTNQLSFQISARKVSY
jgi:hypothetical protein